MEKNAIAGNELFIELDEITFSYDDFGKGEVPVIFIHGFPFNKNMWQPQMNVFKETHRVIALDLRGFGNSSIIKEEISIALFADDLIQFMDKLKIRKAVVCGLSMGGYIALNAVKRYQERFSAIVFSDTQCIADNEEVRKKRMNTIEQINQDGLEKFAEGFVKNIFCESSLLNKPDLVEKILNVILSTSPNTIMGTLKALAERSETCSTLNSISIPTLILCGKEDKVTPTEQSEMMNKAIKNSIFHIIDTAGHMSNLENSNAYNLYLKEFLAYL